jgi:putative ATP-dependent endonuclease of OLD family
MYIAEIRIGNFRCFGSGQSKLTLPLRAGLTALVGENDTGKTAVIDALRFVLGTRDQEYFKVQESDFHCPPDSGERRTEINIRCRFERLTGRDKSAFAEYLTYVESGGNRDAVLFINWTAKDIAGARSTRRFVAVEVRSGENGDGPALDAEARNLLRTTYLRPLRDAERAMSAGRGSRLSQILQHTKEIREVGQDFDPEAAAPPDAEKLSVLGVGDYASALLRNRDGIKAARKRLNEDYLAPLSFSGDSLTADIDVSSAGDNEARLRQLLEKLELELRDPQTSGATPNRGLRSNHVLFMACDLLLLGAEEDGFPLLLIEEPEAHLHPQRQLRLMQYLQEQAETARTDGQQIQVIVTTHSPNLASAIRLGNLILLGDGKAFPLHAGATELEASDYRFLERFLDVTKANLFFARGVVVVEGDGENILLPALARLIGRDFTEHGVSLVNVGGTGLRRFARIFQRKEPEKDGTVRVPVACITDMDVMPVCAPVIVGRLREGDDLPDRADRRWRVESDFTADELTARSNAIREKADGQNVKTFVSGEWTLEYDLAHAGLAKDMWIAAHLAKADDQINAGNKKPAAVITEAVDSYTALVDGLPTEELASRVYALFTTGTKASKAVAAQYLAERLDKRVADGELNAESLTAALPPYLVVAIEYVTGGFEPDAPADQGGADADGQ